MIGSSTKTGSPASLALRLTSGVLWSALVGAAVMGVLLAAALLTRGAVADAHSLSPSNGLAGMALSDPSELADSALAWADRALADPEAHPGLPSPTLIDVVPVAPVRVEVTMLDGP